MAAVMTTVNELGSYTYNARGNLWYNDESSYGKKMLLKMGWKKGKGLGKKEDGIKENLKVKFKNTTSGLGFKDDSYNNVMKTEYESILKGLQSEYPQQKSVNVHENQQKSRIVKSKIRYPRLYCAKDVSKYSDKDMKSILICSLPFKDEKEEFSDSGMSLKKESQNSGLKEDLKDSKLGIKEESESVLLKPRETTSHLSISDYFNMKMKEKKGSEQKKKYISEAKQEETDIHCNNTSYEIEEAKSDFQSNRIHNEKEERYTSESSKSVCKVDEKKKDFQLDMAEEAVKSSNRKKHKKKRKNSEMNVSDISDGNDKIIFPVQEKERMNAISPKKKRKKLAEDSGYEGTFIEEKMQESNLNVDQLGFSHKKRKHKKRLNSTDIEEMPSGQSDVQGDIIPKKKKKKSHRKNNISSNDIELLSLTSLKDEVSANSQLTDSLSLESTETTGETLANVDNHISTKKHKKSKRKFKSIKKLKSCLKSKKNEYAVKNVSFNENVSYQFIDSGSESTGSVSDCEDKLATDFEITASDNPEHGENSGESKTEVEVSSLKEQNESGSSNESFEEKVEQGNSLSSLPSSNSSYYNSWVESQQQALKMQLYQDLLHGITKHDILKTTNLSFIKGYGNWGF